MELKIYAFFLFSNLRKGSKDHLKRPASCKWSSEGTGLLQMIIWRGWPFANDHPDVPAFCKWSFGGTVFVAVFAFLHLIYQNRTNIRNQIRDLHCLLGLVSIFTRLCSKNKEGQFDWPMQSFVHIFVFFEYVIIPKIWSGSGHIWWYFNCMGSRVKVISLVSQMHFQAGCKYFHFYWIMAIWKLNSSKEPAFIGLYEICQKNSGFKFFHTKRAYNSTTFPHSETA